MKDLVERSVPVFDELDDAEAPDESEVLIPLQSEDDLVYLSVRRLDGAGEEREVSSRMPSLDEVINRLTALAGGAVNGLRKTDASKVVIEFGCDFGMESGNLVAIVGKMSGKSTFKIGLEWSAQTNRQ